MRSDRPPLRERLGLWLVGFGLGLYLYHATPERRRRAADLVAGVLTQAHGRT